MQYPPQPPQPPYPQQPYPQQPYPQQPYGHGYPPQPPGPPKKSHTGLIVGLSFAVLVLVIAGGSFAQKASRRAEQEKACNTGCVTNGRCHADKAFLLCIATSAADCRKSQECTSAGACGLRGESCGAVSVEDCRKSTACSERGGCDLVGIYCRPTKAAHCTASSECRLKKRCEYKLADQACYNPSEDTSESESPSSSSSSGGVTYTCPSNCTYVGNGKCRCRRR